MILFSRSPFFNITVIENWEKPSMIQLSIKIWRPEDLSALESGWALLATIIYQDRAGKTRFPRYDPNLAKYSESTIVHTKSRYSVQVHIRQQDSQEYKCKI